MYEVATRSAHAKSVANRMVERAVWLMSLEETYVSEKTRDQLVTETTHMLLDWAHEIGEDSFRAGEFSKRTEA